MSSYICHQTFHATVALIFDPLKNAPERAMIIDTRSCLSRGILGTTWTFEGDTVVEGNGRAEIF